MAARRSAAPPTVTVRPATSTATANRRCPPPPRPSPFRWPTVTSSTASVVPTVRPPASTRRPSCSAIRSPRKPRRPTVELTKQTSWLSALAAVRRPSALARRADLGLRHLPDREPAPPELGLVEHVQHVRLVLGGVDGASQAPPGGGGGTADVVAGGDDLDAELGGAVEERAELDVPVARDARVGGGPGGVGVDVGIDDVAVEAVAEVEDVVVDAELLGDPAGVVDVGDGAAARVLRPSPQLEGHTDHLVALVAQGGGGDRRVHAAAHRHHHLHGRVLRRTCAAGCAGD